MKSTDTTAQMTVIQALSAAMDHIGAVEKKDRNDHFKFQFRGIDAVVNAASPAFRRYGIVVVPTVLDHVFEVVGTGKPTGHFRVTVRYDFYGPAGDSISATVIGEAMDQGDKGMAKAMSVAFRIALLQTLSLPTDETDPDAQSYERVPVVLATDEEVAEIKRAMAVAGVSTDAMKALMTREVGRVSRFADLTQDESEKVIRALWALEPVDEAPADEAPAVETPRLTSDDHIEPITEMQTKRIHVLKRELGLDDDRYRKGMDKITGRTSSKDLSRTQAGDFIKALEAEMAHRSSDAIDSFTPDEVA